MEEKFEEMKRVAHEKMDEFRERLDHKQQPSEPEGEDNTNLFDHYGSMEDLDKDEY